MPNKTIKYYTNTVNLKIQAIVYHLFDKLSLIDKMKEDEKQYFSGLHDSFFEGELKLNNSFSTEYITYRYLPTAEIYARHLHFAFDENAPDTEGVAMCRSDLKPHYNPLIPAFFGLVCYNDVVNNNSEKALQSFWVQVHHLSNIGVEKNGLRLFFYDDGKWYAGITQALASSAFMRAYILSKDEKWKHLAHQSLFALFEPIENGGVFKKTPEGYEWIEEYPLSLKHTFVLNGFIFALTSLYEYLILCEKDAAFMEHLAQLNKTLFKTFHHFKRKKYFKYSRFNWVFQNIEYQGLMVCQFLHLYELSKEDAFNKVARILNNDVNWDDFFSFYNMATPQYFKNLNKQHDSK